MMFGSRLKYLAMAYDLPIVALSFNHTVLKVSVWERCIGCDEEFKKQHLDQVAPYYLDSFTKPGLASFIQGSTGSKKGMASANGSRYFGPVGHGRCKCYLRTLFLRIK